MSLTHKAFEAVPLSLKVASLALEAASLVLVAEYNSVTASFVCESFSISFQAAS